MLGKRLRIGGSIGWLFGCLVWFGFVLVLVWWRLYCSSPILSRIRAVDLLSFLNFVTHFLVRCSPQPGAEAESIGGALLPLLLLLSTFQLIGFMEGGGEGEGGTQWVKGTSRSNLYCHDPPTANH